MTHDEHKARHVELHRLYDENAGELLADYLRHNPDKGLRNTSLMEFMEWSHSQTIEPTEDGASAHAFTVCAHCGASVPEPGAHTCVEATTCRGLRKTVIDTGVQGRRSA